MRFLVVGYFEEEQQVLNDFVEAANKDAALNLVRRARPYATVVDTWTTDESVDTAARMKNATDVPDTALAPRNLSTRLLIQPTGVGSVTIRSSANACGEGEDS
jgi:hypothetical protein